MRASTRNDSIKMWEHDVEENAVCIIFVLTRVFKAFWCVTCLISSVIRSIKPKQLLNQRWNEIETRQ